MSEQVLHDDQSHYEISLTAGQAFIAFVLLLLSLAASFAFGLMIGKGQADERLVVRKEPAVINEGSALPLKKTDGKLVELAVSGDDFKAKTESMAPPAPTITEGGAVPPATTASRAAARAAEGPSTPATPQPVYAQLLSTSDQKTADTLAARLIDRGFASAYVERTITDKGMIFRVRVKFPSDGDARAAETKLREFSKEVWITK
jgi:cell division septation protein DedD